MATPITYVQSGIGFGLGGVVSLPALATVGNTLIALYGARSIVSSAGPTSAHGTWVLLDRVQQSSGGNVTLEMWFCPNISSTSQNITFPTDPNIEIGSVAEYTGVPNLSWEHRLTNIGNSANAATATTGTNSRLNELWFAGAAFARGDYTVGSLTNGFALREEGERGSGTSGIVLGMGDKIVSTLGTAQTTFTIGASAGWGALIAGFKGYDVYTKTHTTDSYLKGTYPKSHTTDSYLKGTFARQHTADSYLVPSPKQHTTDVLLYKQFQRDHFTDSVLVGALQLIHSTDCLVAGISRIPEFTKLVEFTSIEGENVGAHDVKFLSQNGNCDVPDQFTYNVPAQEGVLGLSNNIQLDIIDPIVKDRV